MDSKPRRPRGTGSVTFHKASGRWMARYHGRTVYCESEADAKKAAHQMILDEGEAKEIRRRAREIPGDSTTIEAAMDEYIEYKALSLKDTSLDRIEQVARCNVYPRIGEVICTEFNDKIYYDKLIIPLVREGLSYSSLKKVQDLMFPFCKWCTVQSRRYMARDPLVGLDKMTEASVHGLKIRYGVESPEDVEDEKGGRERVVVLTPAQREKFVRACRAKYSTGLPRFPYGEAFVFVMYTGLRIGEMSALRWQDVDLKGRRIRVKSNLTSVTCRDPDSPQFGKRLSRINPYTKTNRPRWVPLGDAALDSISRMYAQKLPECALVLHNTKGGLIDPVTLQASLRRIYRLAKIRLPSGVNAHALRHTFASICFEKGMSVKQVSELLGHKSTQLTIDTYIHLISDVNLENMPELKDIK